MKVHCDEKGIRVEPEDAQDRAYLRDVIGVRDDGDEAVVRLVAPPLGTQSFVAITKMEAPTDADA